MCIMMVMSTVVKEKVRIRSLTAKQERFVQEYLIDFKAKDAAIRAGYSRGPDGRSAEQYASQLLKLPQVKLAVEAGQAKTRKKGQISIAWVLKRLIHESKTAEKDAARVKALELVGKHLGMFAEKLELTGKNGGPIEVADMSEEERMKRVVVLFQRVQERQIVHRGANTPALPQDDAGRAG